MIFRNLSVSYFLGTFIQKENHIINFVRTYAHTKNILGNEAAIANFIQFDMHQEK